jgi:L-fuculose-phosphate aldolase
MELSFGYLALQQSKSRLAKASRMLYRMGLTAHAEGNLSCRVTNNRFFIKKTGIPSRAIRPDDFVLINEKGKSLSEGTPSSETLLHLEVYSRKPDVDFIIHTHPTEVIRFSKEKADFLHLPRESHAFPATGDVPLVGPLESGSPELATAVGDTLAKGGQAVVIREHGLVVASSTLDEAFDLTIFIEKCARSQEPRV